MIESYIEEAAELHRKILSSREFVQQVRTAIMMIGECLGSGKKVLLAGNGGSAADAQHFAAELIGRYKKERKGFPAIALSTDTSVLTAWSNDYSFDTVFARQVEALGQAGDVFIGFSTSGNSKNIIEAVKTAKSLGARTICLLGKGGGAMKDLPDLTVVVPSDNTPRIQEVHTLLLHIISEELERGGSQ